MVASATTTTTTGANFVRVDFLLSVDRFFWPQRLVPCVLIAILGVPRSGAGEDAFARWFSVQKTAKVPQLQRSFTVADVPVVQVVMVPQVLSEVVNDPVIMQRHVRVSSKVEVPQIQFTARVVDILLCNRDWYAAFIRGVMAAVKGLFDAFCVIFRAPPGCPGVERQFFELSSAHNCECSRAPAGCQIMTVVRWTYTHS